MSTNELIAALGVAIVAALWLAVRLARLHKLAPIALGGAALAVAILLALFATATGAMVLFGLAAALAVVAFADALWRAPRRGPCHNVNRWWAEFERDFHTYARAHQGRRRP